MPQLWNHTFCLGRQPEVEIREKHFENNLLKKYFFKHFGQQLHYNKKSHSKIPAFDRITRIEPAGACGASGAYFNCDATNWTGGKVAPQSPLEESATTEARWHGNDQLPLQIPVQVHVFE